MGGWIKDWRKELDSNIWLMPPLYHRVWQWIKYNVNHEPECVPFPDGTKVLVNPGERITSYRQLAKGVGYYERGVWREPNVKTIKSILDWLENEHMIDVKSNSKYTLIKVQNWGIYQEPECVESNSQETVSKQSLDTNKNDKNDKKDIYIGEISSPEKDPIPYQTIVDLYHELCPSLSRIIRLTDSRKKAIRNRWEEYKDIDTFRTLFAKAEDSDFLSGRNGKWTGCNFDWLMKPSNFIKVLEGNYDNKAGNDGLYDRPLEFYLPEVEQ